MTADCLSSPSVILSEGPKKSHFLRDDTDGPQSKDPASLLPSA